MSQSCFGECSLFKAEMGLLGVAAKHRLFENFHVKASEYKLLANTGASASFRRSVLSEFELYVKTSIMLLCIHNSARCLGDR